ncbi:ATP-dependent endonuclease [Polaromonas sp.]|uniref:ATP-dependent nuclease n=1 Tax=Polaromonas sp. TaxID=1869339 RepID=UPI002730FEF2|nr:AAA family ATPase [Polaromonas sp.]MDP1740711.1 AAA family ATPase [Polaromonas sp.]
MTISAHVRSITFLDSTTIELSGDDVVLIVGPNNCGKSQTLRDIQSKLNNATSPTTLVTSLQLARQGTTQDLEEWLKKTAHDEPHTSGQRIFDFLGNRTNWDNLKNSWTLGESHFHNQAGFFVHLMKTEERLQLVREAENTAFDSAPAHPIGHLQRNPELERRVSEKFFAAFGKYLYVHRNAGRTVPLYVGNFSSEEMLLQPFSHEYVKAVEALAKLQDQGDGMRSFAGVLLNSIVGERPILLIDEPEAFLHPPQARFIGRTIADDKARGRQLFLATHSGDIVRGVLDSKKNAIRILRLQRVANTTTVRELNTASVAEIWRDPLLRHSNILDGLFHDKVVVCEADADCQFYSAILQAVSPDGARRQSDIMFTHCGGKARIAMVVRALSAVGVPTVAVCDFDVLNDERPLRDIVEATGNDWTTVSSDWNVVNTAIGLKKPDLSVAELREELISVAATLTNQESIKSAKSRVATVLRKGSAWAQAKVVGLPFVPSGEASQAAGRLFKSLAGMGIFVVPVGEIEQFCKSAGGHGPAWVNSVLARSLADDPELESARGFVKKLVA